MPDDGGSVHFRDDPGWEPAELYGLPEGCEYRLIRQDEAAGEVVAFCRLPPGYLEPRHEHDAEHWSVVVEGEMHVEGRVLRPGDVFNGPSGKAHGPFEYPQGAVIFTVARGGSILHRYDAAAATDPSD
jgi:quercetin dioxygenase-like cupin family protein